jgi:hypothetical protein
MPALTQLSDGPAAPEFGVGPITPGMLTGYSGDITRVQVRPQAESNGVRNGRDPGR